MIGSGPRDLYDLESKVGSNCIVCTEQFSYKTNAEIDTSEIVEGLPPDPSSGIDAPVAIVLEVVQGQGENEGLMRGVDMGCTESRRLFRVRCPEAGLPLEASDPHDEMLKFMPLLTINAVELATALDIVEARFHEAMAGSVAVTTAMVRESLLVQ